MPSEKHENIVNDSNHFFFMSMGYLFYNLIQTIINSFVSRQSSAYFFIGEFVRARVMFRANKGFNDLEAMVFFG